MQQFQTRSTKCVLRAWKSTTIRTVPDYSFVTRDIFKRNYTQSSIISHRVYGAPPFSPTINRPPKLICMYNVKRFHAAVKENKYKVCTIQPKVSSCAPT